MINFSYFSSNFKYLIFFLILALRMGELPTQEGPGYATALQALKKELISKGVLEYKTNL